MYLPLVYTHIIMHSLYYTLIIYHVHSLTFILYIAYTFIPHYCTCHMPLYATTVHDTYCISLYVTIVHAYLHTSLYSMCWDLENCKKQQQGILPSKRSQLTCYCLVWGIRRVCSLATVGQVTKIKGFTGCGPVHRVYFYIFDLNVWYASA